MKSRCPATFGFFMLALLVCGFGNGCSSPDPNRVQGYVEGEYVYVSSPFGGALEKLSVRRGDEVYVGRPLFELDSRSEKAARDEAERRVAQAKSNLEDAKKGKRPTEIESAEAQLRQARASLTLSEAELKRQEALYRAKSTAFEDVEKARSQRDQDRQRTIQLEADLKTAKLPTSRDDQIAAAEANLRATEAALAKADWDYSQKRQAAPQAGSVFDTLYQEGEWVAAGKPVVVLLPPEHIKVRAFVPEGRVGAIRIGDHVNVSLDGVPKPYVGTVRFISPKAEFTPPVIYSRESRGKLVYMIEIFFEPEVAVNLHPGQPVEVNLSPPP